ncbi:uncharacterized protein L969DRAFT_85548 [Mixia osmundae IAM 14324]|uniref:Uncharacterized protein n=1 Tax=Mixia osmundae (strain CBS 9802 / IAM 14324 / JCM 22182 / KY 12970) TaxID=764103 RepID=G7DTW8_MIXOS|nr:uncharacterized protein L969DRAFT_85548 [Mixia osmundae IAM 14324]KEI41741.1 hypothetical protein L969DRAFT_85548 [Mixia osmundae IAM 14324]GAA94028.1 hypothetical protein E5Q_00675 [Mixia osmundae IAM 14324]
MALNLPYIDLQPDLSDVVNDVCQQVVTADQFWLSVYKLGCSSVHTRIRLSHEQGQEASWQVCADGEPFEGLSIDAVLDRQGRSLSFITPAMTGIVVTCDSLGVHGTVCRLPSRVHPTVSKQLLSFDVTLLPESTFVLGGPDGSLFARSLAPAGLRGLKALQGHLGDITSSTFFPSGEVLLSTSSDLSARVWSAQTGACPRVLKGHTRGLTCSAIVREGKIVLTASFDQSIKLWRLADGVCMATVQLQQDEVVLRIVIVHRDSAGPPPDGHEAIVPEERKGLVGLLAICATRNGSIIIVNLATAVVERRLSTGSQTAVDALACNESTGHVLLGLRNGQLQLWDPHTTQDGAHLLTLCRNDAGINDIAHDAATDRWLIAGADGLAYSVDLGSSPSGFQPRVTSEWAGCSIDTLVAIKPTVQGTFVASKTQGIRHYSSYAPTD